jgi:hypothetical protein
MDQAQRVALAVWREFLAGGDHASMCFLEKQEQPEQVFYFFRDTGRNLPRDADVRAYYVQRNDLMNLTCPVCHKDDKLKVCTGCRRMRFCSKECLRAAWPEHKLLCRSEMTEHDFWQWMSAGKCELLNGVLALTLDHYFPGSAKNREI